MARPKKELDSKTFEGLCNLQCTEDEICGFLDTTDKTLNKWCKRTYGMGFSDTFKKYSQGGKVSLRRNQFRMAETNASMAIWLGKQYLGQRDVVINNVGLSVEDDDLSKSLRNLAKDLQSDD